MHGEDAPAWARWLEMSALGHWARDSAWGYPAANTTHVLGIAMLFGAVLAFDLRLLGVLRGAAVAEAAALLLPLARLGFAVAVLSGVVLFAADATHVLVNPAFQVKAALLGAALLNVVAFHRLALPDLGAPPGAAARAAAAASLLLWAGAIGAGRMIAYL